MRQKTLRQEMGGMSHETRGKICETGDRKIETET